MKTMTCKQWEVPVNMQFQRQPTLKEMAEQSKKHGMQMFKSGTRTPGGHEKMK